MITLLGTRRELVVAFLSFVACLPCLSWCVVTLVGYVV